MNSAARYCCQAKPQFARDTEVLLVGRFLCLIDDLKPSWPFNVQGCKHSVYLPVVNLDEQRTLGL